MAWENLKPQSFLDNFQISTDFTEHLDDVSEMIKEDLTEVNKHLTGRHLIMRQGFIKKS